MMNMAILRETLPLGFFESGSVRAGNALFAEPAAPTSTNTANRRHPSTHRRGPVLAV